MTQEEKQLLLKDLCARLPYGVKVRLVYGENTIEVREMGIGSLHDIMFDNADGLPYLRPMSSMTEEEYNSIDWEECRHVVYYDKNGFCFVKIDSFTITVLDYLNTNYFDYRSLIPMGLALEAPEDMYKTV